SATGCGRWRSGRAFAKPLADSAPRGAGRPPLGLLDWLALDSRDGGWDVKHFLRLRVLSNAYRQSSAVSEQLRQRDPYNALLARQARFRLDAEMVRDNALAVSGLLSPKIGGPSVKPFQPPGYWSFLNFPVREWQKDQGDSVYRRGLYTYWCRTFLHPSLLAFDAPTREECTVDRPRSNTPLQALVLLNDPIFAEAARTLAERALRETCGPPEERVQWMVRRVLMRSGQEQEVTLLVKLAAQHAREYQLDPKGAEALLHTGDRAVPTDL